MRFFDGIPRTTPGQISCGLLEAITERISEGIYGKYDKDATGIFEIIFQGVPVKKNRRNHARNFRIPGSIEISQNP